MKRSSSTETYGFTKRKLGDEQAAAWRRAFVVAIVAAIGTGLGFAWPDHASAFGLLRSAGLSVAAGVAAALLTRQPWSHQ